jgi:hypothetical protein
VAAEVEEIEVTTDEIDAESELPEDDDEEEDHDEANDDDDEDTPPERDPE